MTASLQDAVVSMLGNGLSVAKVDDGNRLTLVVGLKTGSECVLHWGLSPRGRGGAWQRPPDGCWPQGTSAVNGHAVHTPFRANPQGDKEVTIHLDLPCRWDNLHFVLYFPKENRWLNSGGKDFSIPLANGNGACRSAAEALKSSVPDSGTIYQVLPLDGGGQFAAAAWTTPEAIRVRMVSDVGPPLLLHWGLAWQFRHEWLLPPEHFRPAGTSVFDQQATRTPFGERDGLLHLELEFPLTGAERQPRGLKFALYDPDADRWLKSGGKDMYLPLGAGTVDPRLPSPKLGDLAERIVAAEKGSPSWTLMHRFNLCHDLMEMPRMTGRRWHCSSPGCVTAPSASLTGSGTTTPSRANCSHAAGPAYHEAGRPLEAPAGGRGCGHPGGLSSLGAPAAHDAGPRRRRPARPRRDPPDHAPQPPQGD